MAADWRDRGAGAGVQRVRPAARKAPEGDREGAEAASRGKAPTRRGTVGWETPSPWSPGPPDLCQRGPARQRDRPVIASAPDGPARRRRAALCIAATPWAQRQRRRRKRGRKWRRRRQQRSRRRQPTPGPPLPTLDLPPLWLPFCRTPPPDPHLTPTRPPTQPPTQPPPDPHRTARAFATRPFGSVLHCTALVECRFNSGAALVQCCRWHCTGAVLALCWRRSVDTVLKLHGCCMCGARISGRYSVGIAMVL